MSSSKQNWVNLAMLRVGPEFKKRLASQYAEYLDNLPEGEEKLDKGRYYGILFERLDNEVSVNAALSVIHNAAEAEEVPPGGEEISEQEVNQVYHDLSMAKRKAMDLEEKLKRIQTYGSIGAGLLLLIIVLLVQRLVSSKNNNNSAE